MMNRLLPHLLLVGTLLASPLALAQPGPDGPPPPGDRRERGDRPDRGGPDGRRGPEGRRGGDDRLEVGGRPGGGGSPGSGDLHDDGWREEVDGIRNRPSREDMAAVLRDIDPALADRVEERVNGRGGGGHDGRPGRGEERVPAGGLDGESGIRALFPQIARLTRLKEVDPALYDLRVRDIRMERDTDRIVAEARRLRGDPSIDDADDRLEDLHEELEEKVEAHFDLRQEIRAAELERMEKRLEQLKEDLDRRSDDKDALIAQRIAELRGTPEAW